MKTLIVRAEEILEKAGIFVLWAERSICIKLVGIGAALAPTPISATGSVDDWNSHR